MKTLIAGPDWMEFGWLVATYIPALRHVAKGYDKIIILCRPENEYLYRDFATDFIFMEPKKEKRCDRWLFNDKKLKMPADIKIAYSDSKIIEPGRNLCSSAIRKFKKYGKFDERDRYDIVIHARSEAKYGREDRNWPVKNYVKLIKELRKQKELSICSIGTSAYHIPGTEDKRNIPLRQLCNILASSKVAIGPSSGPLHLAALCCCSQVVFTYNEFQKSISGTNKDRYKKYWNPFRIDCTVLDKHNWQPPVDVVEKAVRKYL